MVDQVAKMRESFTTEVGTLSYPHINAPKTNGKFPTGMFHADIVLPEESIAPRVDAFGVKAFGKKWELMKDERDRTPLKKNKDGVLFLGTKSKDRPKVVDAKGTLIPSARIPKIGSGTRARLNVTLNKWEKGVNCYVNGVQIIELQEYGGGNASFSDMSDEAGSDGYKYENDGSDFPESEEPAVVSGNGSGKKASAF